MFFSGTVLLDAGRGGTVPVLRNYLGRVARLGTSRIHARVTKRVEGRNEEDTFPTQYKTNTRSEVNRLAASARLKLESFDYLSQYPNYLMFNGAMFFLDMCYEKVISRFDFLRFLRGWIMVTLRKP